MILKQKYKKPKISFGLGKVEETILLGQTIKIWQNEIFAIDEYNLNYNNVTKPIYGFEITPTTTGEIEIEARMITKVGRFSLPSNTIKLTVI